MVFIEDTLGSLLYKIITKFVIPASQRLKSAIMFNPQPGFERNTRFFHKFFQKSKNRKQKTREERERNAFHQQYSHKSFI